MKGKRNTRQRRLVLDAVHSLTNHPSADEIYVYLRKFDSRISRGTVYRNLNILAEDGEINHIKVPTADRYDFRTDRHYHMICSQCGKVYDAPVEYIEANDRAAEVGTGFKIECHNTVFEGVCSDCQKKS